MQEKADTHNKECVSGGRCQISTRRLFSKICNIGFHFKKRMYDSGIILEE